MKGYGLILLSLILLFPYVLAHSPADETPTDTSIWVRVENANFSIEKSGEMAKIVIEAEGRASPNVDHCGIVFLTVYKNGSTNYNGNFIIGPLNISGKEPLVFMPINGSWEKWRFYNVVYVEKDKLGINESDLGNISSFEIWVRGYGDEDGTKWNQSHAVLTQVVKGEIEDFYAGDENDEINVSVYLVVLTVAMAAVIVLIIWYIKRK